jgi:hypothetical protein
MQLEQMRALCLTFEAEQVSLSISHSSSYRDNDFDEVVRRLSLLAHVHVNSIFDGIRLFVLNHWSVMRGWE